MPNLLSFDPAIPPMPNFWLIKLLLLLDSGVGLTTVLSAAKVCSLIHGCCTKKSFWRRRQGLLCTYLHQTLLAPKLLPIEYTCTNKYLHQALLAPKLLPLKSTCTKAYFHQNILAPSLLAPKAPSTRAGVMSGVAAFGQHTIVASVESKPAGTKIYND